MAKLSEATDDVLIAAYVEIRDRRAQRKAAHDAADADDKSRQEKIEAEVLRRLNERGTDSTSSREHGTAYRNIKTSCTTADRQAFMEQFVIPHQAWEFLDVRPNKTAVEAYKDEHGVLPPGINWSEMAAVGFRRS